MQEISLNILLGVVAGLTATVISLGISDFWKKRFIPWFEERIYKDAKIEGRWYGLVNYHDQDCEMFYFDIIRKSHRIYGDMTSKDDGRSYSFNGEFRNMLLTVIYESKDPQEVDRGGFTFLLVKNGQELDGCASYYFNSEHKVRTGKIVLTRDESSIAIAEQKNAASREEHASADL